MTRNPYTLHVPDFLHIEEEDFRPDAYAPSTFDVAAASLCWRHDPSDPTSATKLQSNARVIKWSDGSMTLQLAANPKEHYRIVSKRLARPASLPHTSTNNSSSNGNGSGSGSTGSSSTTRGKADIKDSHVYLGTPSDSADVLRLSAHVTAALDVLPTTTATDSAVEALRSSLAAAAFNKNLNPDGSVVIVDVKEDPELAKKRAEAAEREKLRAERKR
ncbi:hypothetical protein KEM52_004699, partial [Ascosphaera acerosa]